MLVDEKSRNGIPSKNDNEDDDDDDDLEIDSEDDVEEFSDVHDLDAVPYEYYRKFEKIVRIYIGKIVKFKLKKKLDKVHRKYKHDKRCNCRKEKRVKDLLRSVPLAQLRNTVKYM